PVLQTTPVEEHLPRPSDIDFPTLMSHLCAPIDIITIYHHKKYLFIDKYKKEIEIIPYLCTLLYFTIYMYYNWLFFFLDYFPHHCILVKVHICFPYNYIRTCFSDSYNLFLIVKLSYSILE